MLILNGLYCDTIFVTEYYGVARWTSSKKTKKKKKSDNFNNSLKCARRIIDNTQTHMEIVSSLHVLNVHIRYVHYTYTYSKNFARLTANLSFMLRAFRRRPRCLPSLRLFLNRSTSVSLFGFFWFWKTSFERKRTNKQKKSARESLKKQTNPHTW